MQPLYTKKEFMSSKTYDKLPFKCKNCNETFYREKYRIVSVINKKGTATIEFCSRKCSNLNKNTEKLLKCEYCEKEIYKRPVDIKNNKHIFCSSSCTGKFYANDTSMRNNKQIKLNCKQCNKEIYKAPARIKKSKNSFCSVSCTTKYNLAHINMRSKNSRSKLEF